MSKDANQVQLLKCRVDIITAPDWIFTHEAKLIYPQLTLILKRIFLVLSSSVYLRIYLPTNSAFINSLLVINIHRFWQFKRTEVHSLRCTQITIGTKQCLKTFTWGLHIVIICLLDAKTFTSPAYRCTIVEWLVVLYPTVIKCYESLKMTKLYATFHI